MNLFHGIKQDKAPQMLKLVSEIAKGDFVKYEYNNEYGVLEVDRILYGPVHYPVVYADVPRTWNTHDGDPLDAVVYTTGNIVRVDAVSGSQTPIATIPGGYPTGVKIDTNGDIYVAGGSLNNCKVWRGEPTKGNLKEVSAELHDTHNLVIYL